MELDVTPKTQHERRKHQNKDLENTDERFKYNTYSDYQNR